MKVNLKKACAFLLFCIALNVSAGELSLFSHEEDNCERSHFIVSDLDDTIKYTHSNSKVMAVFHMTFSRGIYSGMDELIRRMSRQTEIGAPCGENAQAFAVLSASATFALDKINSLLNRYRLPNAQVVLRNVWNEKIPFFKRDHLRRIYKKRHLPLILLGDDTMHDHDVYHEFKQENPDKVIATYIHVLNKRTALPDQRPFYTAFDVAFAEYLDGRLDKDDVLAVGKSVLQAEKDKYIIPKFGHCPTILPNQERDSGEAEIEAMKNSIQAKVTGICKARMKKTKK